jgi:hypothetical protein
MGRVGAAFSRDFFCPAGIYHWTGERYIAKNSPTAQKIKQFTKTGSYRGLI